MRAILNFGHTIGHALEAATNYGFFLHGEAILHGMRGALHLSQIEGGLRDDLQPALALIESLQPPPIPENIRSETIHSAMIRDKKRSRSGQLWVLLKRIGGAELTRNVSEAGVNAAVEFVLN